MRTVAADQRHRRAASSAKQADRSWRSASSVRRPVAVMPPPPGPNKMGVANLMECGARTPPAVKVALVGLVLLAGMLGNSYIQMVGRLSARHSRGAVLASRDGLLAVTRCPEQLQVDPSCLSSPHTPNIPFILIIVSCVPSMANALICLCCAIVRGWTWQHGAWVARGVVVDCLIGGGAGV